MGTVLSDTKMSGRTVPINKRYRRYFSIAHAAPSASQWGAITSAAAFTLSGAFAIAMPSPAQRSMAMSFSPSPMATVSSRGMPRSSAARSDSYGGSLGNVFLNYNGATYNPQYIFSEQILNLYESNDFRTSVFCAQQENSAGNTVYMIVKYPGNPNLDSGLQQNFINMPKPLRLSEVYLIRAEAYYNLGKAT